MKKLLLVISIILPCFWVSGQGLTGDKFIPGDYSTIQLAIADLNTNGVGMGGVIFNVAAGHTETLADGTAGLITATGNATDTIVFRKNPATSGANPVITSFLISISSATDGIIKIAGGDYITFDGIDLVENPSNTASTKRTEWGFALVKKQNTAPFDGCQHIVIKNCTITLSLTNANSVGIYTGNHISTATTALTLASTSDAHNYNKFISNTITNAYVAIKLNGFNAPSPYELYDIGNEVGSGGGNMVSNFGNSTGYGIYATYQNLLKIMNNSITVGAIGGTQFGIEFINANSASCEIANNNISMSGTGFTCAIYGIHCTAGLGGTSNTIDIHGNTVSNCTTSGAVNGIYYSSSAKTVNLYDNDIFNINITGNVAIQGIYAVGSGTVTGNMNIYGNNINNLENSTGGSIKFIVTGGYSNNNIYSNQLYGGSSSTGTVYGIHHNSAVGNCSLYGNSIYDLTSNESSNAQVYGIYFQAVGASTATIYNNFISDLKAGQANVDPAIVGIYLPTGNAFNVSNNTVFLNASSTGSGFGTAALYTVTSAATTLRNNIFVNVSTPGATGRTVCYRRSNSTKTTYSANSNYNYFYSGIPGPQNLIYYDVSYSDTTIELFKSRMSPRDSLSFTEIPAFQNDTLSPFDLHISTETPTLCESGGITIASPDIANDIDGNPRFPNSGYPDNAEFPSTAPDVGADEFGGIRNDLTPPTITVTPLAKTSSHEERTIIATIVDEFAGIPETAPGLPILYWKINDNPGWNSSVGILTSGSDYSFTLGNGVATGDVVYYYICAQDGFINPNVAVSPAEGADSLAINPPSCDIVPAPTYAYRIVDTLPAGDYLIGGIGNTPSAGCTYVDITQAFGDVNDVLDHIVVTHGGNYSGNPGVVLIGGGGTGATAEAVMSGDSVVAVHVINNGSGYYTPPIVTFYQGDGSGAQATAYLSAGKEIRGPVNFILDTSYRSTEENFFPLHLEPVLGADASNTITLKPGPLSTPTIWADEICLLKLNGADYFTLDGSNNGSASKDLTLSYISSSYYGAMVWLASASETDGANFNTIKNCIIHGAPGNFNPYAGIFSGGDAGIGATAYALTPNSGNTFENNAIYNTKNGIVLLGRSPGSLDENNIIFGNELGNEPPGEGFDNQGIMAMNQNNGLISGNHVQNIVYSGQYHEVTGIFISNCKNMEISGNKVHHISQSLNGASFYVDGILQRCTSFNSADNPSNNSYFNNVVYDLTSKGQSSNYNVVGLHNNSGWGDKYFFNSVFLNGQLNQEGASNGSLSSCFANGKAVNSGDASNIEVKNNIFFINSHNSSGANHHYTHYTTLPSYSGSSLDYNILFDSVTGTAIGHTGYLNTDQDELSDWQTATLQEGSSLSVNPLFNSDTSLVPVPSSPVIGAGIPIPGIDHDFLGNSRDAAHPSMGAYEIGAFSDKVLNLKFFIEGLYDSNIRQMVAQKDEFGLPVFGEGIADQVIVELHDATIYDTIEYARYEVNLKTDGTCTLITPAVHNGWYYITIKHRNSVETTTLDSVSFYGGIINLDFTIDDASVFGNNLKQIATGVYAIYSGDVNEDNSIDQEDIDAVIGHAALFTPGPDATDINGDGIVDAIDSILTENNAALFVTAKTP